MVSRWCLAQVEIELLDFLLTRPRLLGKTRVVNGETSSFSCGGETSYTTYFTVEEMRETNSRFSSRCHLIVERRWISPQSKPLIRHGWRLAFDYRNVARLRFQESALSPIVVGSPIVTMGPATGKQKLC